MVRIVHVLSVEYFWAPIRLEEKPTERPSRKITEPWGGQSRPVITPDHRALPFDPLPLSGDPTLVYLRKSLGCRSSHFRRNLRAPSILLLREEFCLGR